MDWSNCPAVERKPGKISGGWAFNEFVEWFPGVDKKPVRAVLDMKHGR